MHTARACQKTGCINGKCAFSANGLKCTEMCKCLDCCKCNVDARFSSIEGELEESENDEEQSNEVDSMGI